MSDVQIHGEKTREALRLLDAGIHQAAELAVRGAVEAARESAKVTTLFKDQSHETRDSIEGEAFGVHGTVVASGAAFFLENGTRQHIIVAHGQALRFVVNGQVMFRKWVRHPGTKATHFMGEAADRGEIALDYGMDFYVGEAIRRI